MDVSEDLGTTLMLENDRVRIWEHRVPAGAAIMISERLISPEAVDEALASDAGPVGGEALAQDESRRGRHHDRGSVFGAVCDDQQPCRVIARRPSRQGKG